jgi:hypothetical protein
MGYVSCLICSWFAHYTHTVYGKCPKCGGYTESLD